MGCITASEIVWSQLDICVYVLNVHSPNGRVDYLTLFVM